MDQISDVSLQPLTDSRYIKTVRMNFIRDGKKRAWDLIHGHDSVVILLHNISRDLFVFVSQFRPAIYMNNAFRDDQPKLGTLDTSITPGSAGVTFELCAGIVDKDCSVAEIAQQELMEECGYDVPLEKLEKVTTARSGVGVSGQRQTMFYAQVTDDMKTAPGGGNPDEGEMITLVEIPVKDSLNFILDDTNERPIGLMFAVMWFHTCKSGQLAR